MTRARTTGRHGDTAAAPVRETRGQTCYLGVRITVEEIDRALADLAAGRDSPCTHATASDCLCAFLRQAARNEVDDDEDAAAFLLALRSTCHARHAPVCTLSELAFTMSADGFRSRDPADWLVQGLVFLPLGILALPVDAVQLCVQLPKRAVEHAKVTQEDIDRALADLARARASGYTGERHYLRFKFWQPRHLDGLGYELPSVK